MIVTRTPSIDNEWGIYIVRCDGFQRPVKIGMSKNTSVRIAEMQISHWRTVIVEDQFFVESKKSARKIERKAHDAFSYCHLRGEWFDVKGYEAVEMVKRILRLDGYDLSHHEYGAEDEILDELDKFLSLRDNYVTDLE